MGYLLNAFGALAKRVFQYFIVIVACLSWAATAQAQSDLVFTNVGNPIVTDSAGNVSMSDYGSRALWANGGTVGGTIVDIVAIVETSTQEHRLQTNSGRPAVRSSGPDEIWIRWYIYQAGTHNISTNSGGIPITANIHVQINDIDGPNNEEVFVPVCTGDVTYIRIDSTATTGRTFGTVNGVPDTFSLIGDQGYSNQPNSGLEINYPNTSNFLFGRTAANVYYIRLDNPTYSAFDTFDYECADFQPPVSADDTDKAAQDTDIVLSILDNDSLATENNNGPHNNSQAASEYGRQSVSLVAPAGATGVSTDADGDVIGFTVPGEGTWSFDNTTGDLTFDPLPDFTGAATVIDYTFDNALGISSPAASVSVSISGIGVVKSSSFNDENGDGYIQIGETIDYTYNVTALGVDPINTVVLTETGFTGAGTTPTPTLTFGDTADLGILNVGETWLYVASYTVIAADLIAGNNIANQATATGQTPGGASVSDLSDSNNPSDGNGMGTAGPGTNNDDTTNTALTAKPIVADNDDFSAVPIFPTGGTTASVFGDDTLDGNSFVPADVAVTMTNNGGIAGLVMNADGTLTIPTGTAVGPYTITYEICEVGNPTNCDTATVVIAVAFPPIGATNDNPADVDGRTGDANIGNALDNDLLNGAPVVPADVTLSVQSPATPVVAGAPVPNLAANGVISVPPMTPAGTYNISYEICENSNPTNCDDAVTSVTVLAATLVADDDDFTATPILPTGGNTASVFDNDTLNAAGFVGADVVPTILNDGGLTGVTINADGTLTILPGATEGPYTVTYQICEALNPANCVDAEVDLIVAFPPLTADDDVIPNVNGYDGDVMAANILDNDDYNGATADITDIDITVVTPATPIVAGAPVPAIDPATGIVSVPPMTPAGTYTIDYQLCETANPTNCDPATVNVTVEEAPIEAIDNDYTATHFLPTGDTTPSVFDNDTLNGAAIVLAEVTPSIVNEGGLTGVTINADGTLDIPANTPEGPYTIEYEICEVLNPMNCDTAFVELIVAFPPLEAVNDNPIAVNGDLGAPNFTNVLSNDDLDSATATISTVDISIVSPATPLVAGANVPVLDPNTGNVSVPAGTPEGNYTIEYEICETVNPTNCDTAIVTVMVDAGSIVAGDNSPPPVNSTNGNPNAGNVLDNDSLSGNPGDLTKLALTIASPATPFEPGAPVPTVDPSTGIISVIAGTPEGTYTIEYEICEILNPTNCDTATVTVEVEAAEIDAVDVNPAPVNSTDGDPSVANVLDNDTFNGGPADLTAIRLSVLPSTSTGTPIPILDPNTGNVAVPAGTPAGTYTIEYGICDPINLANCDSAIVTIVVEAAEIEAQDLTPAPVNATDGNPSVANVLDNDTFNGGPADLADIDLSILTPATPAYAGAPVPALDPTTGNVAVPAGTPAGTYTIEYEICDPLNPTNCDTAIVTVVVEAAEIDAVDVTPAPVNATDGNPSVANVLGNDTFNGAPVDLADIDLSILTPATPAYAGAPVPALDPTTGNVAVPAGTPAGTYTIEYQICDVLNPTNCDTAVVTVVVEAAEIDAVDVTPAPVNATDGNPSVANVLGNDTFNGGPVDLADIDLSVLTPATPAYAGAPVPALDPTTGNVAVPAGTPAGTYTIEYQICDKLNPTNCDTAVVTVVVEASEIDAVDVTPAVVDGAKGDPSLVNVLDNDTFNGGPVDLADITLAVSTPATPAFDGASVPALDPVTGNVAVPAGTPAGTYTIVYEICDTVNPTNCDTATVTIVIEAAEIVAENDDYSANPVDPALGGDIGNIFDNDTLNGSAITPDDVKLTLADDGGLTGVMISPTGLISLPANSIPGTYTFVYEICEALNPSNCETAEVTIVVAPYPDTGPQPDESLNNVPGMPVTIKVVANDPDPHNVMDVSSLQIMGTNAAGDALIVPGQGVWSVDPDKGTITFTPQDGFKGNPTPIEYAMNDKWGNQMGVVRVTITYQVAPAFSCTDIIGKVHEDFNANGRQDDGEMGISAARLVTVNGDIITADEHGRYSIPCAALPRDHGSNFLVKLDPSSLPTGYRMTTENPRVVRLSPGLMSRINFGATVGNVVEMTLNGDAFESGTASLGPQLSQAISSLSSQFGSTPITVIMTYEAKTDEARNTIKKRLKSVERYLKQTAPHRSRATLKFEQVILRRSR